MCIGDLLPKVHLHSLFTLYFLNNPEFVVQFLYIKESAIVRPHFEVHAKKSGQLRATWYVLEAMYYS